MRPATLLLLLALFASPARGGAPVAWTTEENVSSTPTDTETGLNHRPLAVTADGVLHAAWAERDSPNEQYRIWTRRLGASGWSAAELIVDYPATDPGDPGDDIGAKYPALCATPDGDLHLFWHDYRVAGIANVEIFTKTLPSGGAWDSSRAADVRLTTTDHAEVLGDNGYVPVPVAASDGALHVVWWDYRFEGDHAEILAKTRPAGGQWNLTPGDSADVRVTADADHSELPAVAADAAGRVHAAWRSVGAGASILYAERDPGGAWSAPLDIDLGGLVQGAPALAIDGSGTVHVAWPDARSGGRALYTRARASGVWAPAVERITSPAHGADEPSLAGDEDGALHLVWSDARHGFFDREIFYRTKLLGAPWDTAAASDFRVSNADSNSTRPSVVAHGAIVTIAWKDERGGNHDLWIRRGGPSGTGAPPAAPEAPAWLAFPNPTRGAVRLLRPPDASSDLVVLDVAGRAVRRLSGSGEVAWDGRDARGAPVPAGVYFVREAASRRAIRLTVLR
jgi:hypothetical protein